MRLTWDKFDILSLFLTSVKCFVQGSMPALTKILKRKLRFGFQITAGKRVHGHLETAATDKRRNILTVGKTHESVETKRLRIVSTTYRGNNEQG